MLRRARASMVAILLAGCSALPDPVELDRGAAIAAADKHIGDPVDPVVSAGWTPTLPDGRAPDPPDRGIWTIEFGRRSSDRVVPRRRWTASRTLSHRANHHQDRVDHRQ